MNLGRYCVIVGVTRCSVCVVGGASSKVGDVGETGKMRNMVKYTVGVAGGASSTVSDVTVVRGTSSKFGIW